MARGVPSLLRRQTLAQALILTLCWGILLAAIIRTASGQRSGHFDLNLEVYAESLAEACDAEADPVRVAPALRRVQRIFDETLFVFLERDAQDYRSIWQVLDASGRVVHRSEGAPPLPLAARKEGFSEGSWGGQNWRVASATSESGTWAVHVAESLDARRSVLMGGIVRLFAIIFAAVFPVALLMVWVANRTSLRPLLRLAEEVHGRQAEDLRPLDFQTRLAELAPLTEAINGLMARLKHLLEAHHRFLSDAAHELRTPIAGAEVQVHALRHAASEEARSGSMAAIHASLARAGYLIRQLLILARLDAGEGPAPWRTLDLGELCRAQLGQAYHAAQERSVELAMEAEGLFPLEGETEALRSLVSNLLENAIRHGRAGGHVLLRLERADDDLHLSVLDDGPGIPPEAREAVLERFYRLPGTQAPGSGLGLSIVQAAADRHGGTVTLGEGLEGRGAGIRVRLKRWRNLEGGPSHRA